jgi:hypothetical protein
MEHEGRRREGLTEGAAAKMAPFVRSTDTCNALDRDGRGFKHRLEDGAFDRRLCWTKRSAKCVKAPRIGWQSQSFSSPVSLLQLLRIRLYSISA